VIVVVGMVPGAPTTLELVGSLSGVVIVGASVGEIELLGSTRLTLSILLDFSINLGLSRLYKASYSMGKAMTEAALRAMTAKVTAEVAWTIVMILMKRTAIACYLVASTKRMLRQVGETG